jgi:hypothetical protein
MRWTGAALLMLLAMPAAAEGVYRWVDEQGRVHFGDRPAGADSRPVELPGGATVDADAAARRERQRQLLEAFEQDRREHRERSEQARQEQAARAARCARARDQARVLEVAGRVYEMDAAGNRTYLSDAARDETLARAREAVERWCR